MRLLEKVNAGAFKNQKRYSRRRDNPEDYAAYVAEERRLESEFRAALEAQEADAEWPGDVRDALYAKAWEDGHSFGFSEVLLHYQDMAELVRVAYNAGKAARPR